MVDKTVGISAHPEPEELPRRRFLDRLLGGSLATLAIAYVGGVLAYLAPAKKSTADADQPVDAGEAAALAEGQALVVQKGDTPVIVVHTKDDFVALSAVCTHLGCIVAWDDERQQIHCPCHGAAFDLRGNVVSGPPPSPLPAMAVQVRDGHIWVGGEPS